MRTLRPSNIRIIANHGRLLFRVIVALGVVLLLDACRAIQRGIESSSGTQWEAFKGDAQHSSVELNGDWKDVQDRTVEWVATTNPFQVKVEGFTWEPGIRDYVFGYREHQVFSDDFRTIIHSNAAGELIFYVELWRRPSAIVHADIYASTQFEKPPEFIAATIGDGLKQCENGNYSDG